MQIAGLHVVGKKKTFLSKRKETTLSTPLKKAVQLVYEGLCEAENSSLEKTWFQLGAIEDVMGFIFQAREGRGDKARKAHTSSLNEHLVSKINYSRIVLKFVTFLHYLRRKRLYLHQ